MTIVHFVSEHESKERKTGHNQENSCKYLPFGEKNVKIGPVDTEIALLIVKKRKKEEINVSKICSSVGRFAEQAKKNKELEIHGKA